MAENPVEFLPLQKEIAECKSYATWFEKGTQMLTSDSKNCQPAIYQMIMRNMFDWDKETQSNKESSEPLIRSLAKKWRGK